MTDPDPAALPLQTCELGDLTLESGAVIPNLRMTYVTQGRLNADRSNAILLLHGLVADHNQLTSWTGADGAFDPEKYFIIQPDTLGVTTDDPNATTSATRSGLKMAFPRFTIRDMVAAEHRLLTEGLGIDHLVAVAGVSMGGVGTIQWAVSFPDFMDAIVAVTTQTRAHRQGALLWETARQAIMLDPKWQDGDYADDDPPRSGTLLGLLVQSLYGGSPAGFEQRFTSGKKVVQFYEDQSETLGGHTYPRDWVYRTWALDTHDIAGTPEFDGDLAAAARSIRAQALLIVNSCDQLLPPHACGVVEAAHHILVAKLVDMEAPGGHYAHRDRVGMALIADETRSLLDRLADGRPGLSGPRFPPHWSQSEVAVANTARAWESSVLKSH